MIKTRHEHKYIAKNNKLISKTRHKHKYIAKYNSKLTLYCNIIGLFVKKKNSIKVPRNYDENGTLRYKNRNCKSQTLQLINNSVINPFTAKIKSR